MYFEQAVEQPNEQPNAQAEEQAAEHIITKLNLLFNYIYKKDNGHEIGLKENDREFLIDIYQKVEMYDEGGKGYSIMPERMILDEKIMMYAVKELYLSPYRMFINNLTREMIVLKYLKTKKYIESKEEYELEEVIKYLVSCLQSELEGKG